MAFVQSMFAEADGGADAPASDSISCAQWCGDCGAECADCSAQSSRITWIGAAQMPETQENREVSSHRIGRICIDLPNGERIQSLGYRSFLDEQRRTTESETKLVFGFAKQ